MVYFVLYYNQRLRDSQHKQKTRRKQHENHKKSFIETMTANETVFLGVTKRLYTEDEVYCYIQDLLDPDIILNKRICKEHANFLEFTGGSRLDFYQKGKYEFYSYTYPEGVVYVCLHTYYDVWDEKDMYRAIYYLVKN